MTELTLALADEMRQAALVAARGLDTPMSVAVCDAGGHLVSFSRMDGCMVLAAETVQAKARTAVYFQRPTAETVERSVQHPTVYTTFAEVASAPIVLSMGGFPLWDEEGRLRGAIAAAGGTGAEDIQVAEAGLLVWSATLPD